MIETVTEYGYFMIVFVSLIINENDTKTSLPKWNKVDTNGHLVQGGGGVYVYSLCELHTVKSVNLLYLSTKCFIGYPL